MLFTLKLCQFSTKNLIGHKFIMPQNRGLANPQCPPLYIKCDREAIFGDTVMLSDF